MEKSQKIILSTDEIADRYGFNRGTLANLRSQGKGCRYYKVGRKVFYRIEDIEKWLFSNPVLTIDSVKGDR